MRVTRGLVQACHPGPTALVTAFGAAAAAASGLGAVRTLLVGLAVLVGQLSVGWSNDWRDAGDDLRTNRAEKPVVRGDLTRSGLGVATAIAAVLCVPASLALGWRAGVVHLVAVASAWGYNFVLKPTVLSWLPFAVSFGLLPSVVALALPGHPWADPAVRAVSALFGVAAHLTNGVKDMAADAATGVRGLPQRLGVVPATSLSALTVLAATAVLASARPGPSMIPVGAAVVVLASAAVLRAVRGRPDYLFELSMAAAVPVVIGLVVTGGVR